MVFRWTSQADHQLLLALVSQSSHSNPDVEIRITVRYKAIASIIGGGCTAATVQERVQNLRKIALSDTSCMKSSAPKTSQAQSKAIHIDLSGPAPHPALPRIIQLPSHAPSATPEKRPAEPQVLKVVPKREASDELQSIDKKPRISGPSLVKLEIPPVDADTSSLDIVKRVCAENAALEQTIAKRDSEMEGLKNRIKELSDGIAKLGRDGKQTVDALTAERERLEGKLKTSRLHLSAQVEVTKAARKDVVDMSEKSSKLRERNALLSAKVSATGELLDALRQLEGKARKMQAFTGKAKNLPSVIEK